MPLSVSPDRADIKKEQGKQSHRVLQGGRVAVSTPFYKCGHGYLKGLCEVVKSIQRSSRPTNTQLGVSIYRLNLVEFHLHPPRGIKDI